jgi:hypothetical protein
MGVVSSPLGLRLDCEDEGTVLLETSVNVYQLMQIIPEDLNLQQGHCENLKSH